MDQSVVFSVDDLAVYPITDPGDSATDPTYGALVDVPAVSEVTFDADVVEAMLRGDGRTVDQRTILQAITNSWTYGKLSPAVLAAIDGGTTSTNTGATSTRYVRNEADQVPEFGLACRIVEVDNPGGSALFALFRAKITGGTLFGATQDEYGEPTFDTRGIGLDSDGSVYSLTLSDTADDMPADGPALLALRTALV